MNPDNPYAAPQTVQLRATGELPVAEAYGRNHFPELDTRRLGRLADFSHTMQLMTRLWVIPFVISGFLCANYRTLPVYVQGSLLLVVPLVGLRLVGGFVRGTRSRYVTALLDGLGFLALLTGIVAGFVTAPDGASRALFLPLSIAAAFLAIISFTSFLAHCYAPELFGPQRYPHRDLMQEVDYRKQQGIA